MEVSREFRLLKARLDGELDLTKARCSTYFDEPETWPASVRPSGFTYDMLRTEGVTRPAPSMAGETVAPRVVAERLAQVCEVGLRRHSWLRTPAVAAERAMIATNRGVGLRHARGGRTGTFQQLV